MTNYLVNVSRIAITKQTATIEVKHAANSYRAAGSALLQVSTDNPDIRWADEVTFYRDIRHDSVRQLEDL